MRFPWTLPLPRLRVGADADVFPEELGLRGRGGATRRRARLIDGKWMVNRWLIDG